ncbi:MAG: hypothetical protein K8R21_02270 [Leptospira sp.]|nr:hypothetical protein [Leptospira sp.]
MKVSFEEAFETDQFIQKLPGVHWNKDRLLPLIEEVKEFLPDRKEKIIGEWSMKAMDTFWIVQMLHILKNGGFIIHPPNSAGGPDIFAEKNGQKFYIECVNPRNWETPEEQKSGYWKRKDKAGNHFETRMDYPQASEKKRVLKYRDGIKEKHEKYQTWISKKKINANIPYLIAICGGNQTHSDIYAYGNDVPEIVKSVYPIGDKFYSVPLENIENLSVQYMIRNSITDQFNKDIPTDSFLDDNYESISGILFHPYNNLNDTDLNGMGLVLVHNAKEKNKIPAKFIPNCREWDFDLGTNILSNTLNPPLPSSEDI